MSAEITETDARRLTERIKLIAGTVADNLEKIQGLLAQAQASDVHTILGFPSWTAYVADTLGEMRQRLTQDQRRDAVALLANQGMSTRAIAKSIGASKTTVTADLSQIGTPRTKPTSGLDGKIYASAPKPPARRLRPLPEAARDAAFDLVKATERVMRIVADDRYRENEKQVGDMLRNSVLSTAGACQKVLDQIGAGK